MKMSNGSSFLASMLLLSFLIASFFHTAVGHIGVSYGRVGNNLQPASDVVALYQQRNITWMRLYDPNPEALKALRGSNIELELDVPNSDLANVSSSQAAADTWVRNNVRNYENVRFRYIAVGNEVQPSSGDAKFVLPAMENIERAVSGLGIKVSTAIDTKGMSGFPPSSGTFTPEFRKFIEPIIGFLVSKKSPLLVNIYPYFSYRANPNQITLDYALFRSQSPVVEDKPYSYRNLFHATLDTMYVALEKSGGGSVEIVVSESGWPTDGGFAASMDNARTYVNNLVQTVKSGTPRKPDPVETYIFALYDENMKPGDPVERFWGMFNPNLSPKYDVNFN